MRRGYGREGQLKICNKVLFLGLDDHLIKWLGNKVILNGLALNSHLFNWTHWDWRRKHYLNLVCIHYLLRVLSHQREHHIHFTLHVNLRIHLHTQCTNHHRLVPIEKRRGLANLVHQVVSSFRYLNTHFCKWRGRNSRWRILQVCHINSYCGTCSCR